MFRKTLSWLTKTASLFFFILVIIIGILSYSGQSLTNSNGAPPGYTGSPTDGNNCSACHAHMDSIIDNVNWISTDIPPQGYYHSGVYNITVNIPEPGTKGFEASIQDVYGNLSGGMMAGANTQIVGSGKYITQSTPGLSNPQTWSFQWFPGSGNVNLYAAYTVDTNSTYIQTLMIEEEPCFHCHPGIPSFYYDSTRFYSSFSDNTVRIFFNTFTNDNNNLFLYSANGELLKHLKNIIQQKGQNYFDINVEDMNNGIYFIVLDCGNFKATSKIFISK
jgi:hypothetical protein